jgi:hypothetical protein
MSLKGQLKFPTPEHQNEKCILKQKTYCKSKFIDECELKKPRTFLHLKFDNKGIDAVNILNQKNLQSCIPRYFDMKSTLCISYRYASTIASKTFITNKPCSA